MADTINTQITLPIAVYQAIAQRAELHGQSVSHEIATLLLASLQDDNCNLDKEIADWERATDEDWISMEMTLSSPES